MGREPRPTVTICTGGSRAGSDPVCEQMRLALIRTVPGRASPLPAMPAAVRGEAGPPTGDARNV